MKKKIIFFAIVIIIIGFVAALVMRTIRTQDESGDEHMPIEYIFDKNGCLNQDVKNGYIADIACLDPDNDGCITRAEWDGVMNYWNANTPQPGQSLCDRE
ncbi:MAG: hypothetical protein LBO08_00705 [Rickettsiales bacterium]|jgi:hypothetical protein|nr:hypothetical protein [Rickettsiales bacterium]